MVKKTKPHVRAVKKIYEVNSVPHASRAKNRQYQLQNEIIEIILREKLVPGDPLPTEQQLIEELDVGRNSLREALKVLEGLGIIEVRHGFGTFVGGRVLEAMTRGLTFRGLTSLHRGGKEARELTDVRQALETGLIALAIPLMSDEQIAKIEYAVTQMEQAVKEGKDWSYWDREFHASLYEPLKNDLLSELLEVFWIVYNVISVELDAIVPASQKQGESLVAAHRDILNAVKKGDAIAGTELMAAHFAGIRGRLTAWQRATREDV
ncbi:FadR/GntR family transcriptional regulator [Rothia sp. P6271]|uniref:FadR/GntR family transcriptional regulator n=1 Tax=Rothia sp. P6271 TaxID=3402659 RepID=UPI003ACC7D2F